MKMTSCTILLLAPLISGCVAGAGLDRSIHIRAAKQWRSGVSHPAVASTTESVPRKTYAYKPTNPFDGSPHRGKGIRNAETSVQGTDYRVAYREHHLTIHRNQALVVSERLPAVYYMHPLYSAVLSGRTPAEDVLVCSIRSRASTRCHLLLLYDGSGRELFVRTFNSATVADIQVKGDNQIILGGPTSHTILTVDRDALRAEQTPAGDSLKAAPEE
jgi:hypothetical protein